jgi:hypothetical protein
VPRIERGCQEHSLSARRKPSTLQRSAAYVGADASLSSCWNDSPPRRPRSHVNEATGSGFRRVVLVAHAALPISARPCQPEQRSHPSQGRRPRHRRAASRSTAAPRLLRVADRFGARTRRMGCAYIPAHGRCATGRRGGSRDVDRGAPGWSVSEGVLRDRADPFSQGRSRSLRRGGRYSEPETS